MEVEHIERDRFTVRIRGHELVVDQPEDVGGDDVGPTPTELFVAGLASCVAFYAERFLRRHELPDDDLRVEALFDMAAGQPARVASIVVRVFIPVEVPTMLQAALERMVNRCTVHNSLLEPPQVSISLREEAAAA